MVMLGDFPHAELSPEQIDTLRGYAEAGGNLLVPTGAHWQRLSSSPLADLWPLSLTSSGAANSAQVNELVHRYVPKITYGGDRLGGSPVVLAGGSLQPGATVSEGTLLAPILALKDTGAGHCLMLAYDPAQPPFLGWSGLQALWKELFAASTSPRRLTGVEPDAAFGFANGGYPYGSPYPSGLSGPSDAGTANLQSTLSRAKQLRMPPLGQIAWYLALYVFILVPVNYAVLHFMNKREWAWVTIPVIVIAFSLFAYQSALSIRGRAILTRQVDIVQSSLGSGGGRVDTLFWLFSPRKTTYDISSQGKSASVAEYLTGKREPAPLSILQPAGGASFVDQNVGLYQWTDRSFVGRSLVDFKSGLRLTGGKAPLLQNGTPYTLRSAVLVKDGRVLPFGDVNPGATAKAGAGDGVKDAGVALTGRILNAAHLDKIFDAATLANNIPGTALTLALVSSFGKLNDQALIVAWSDQAVSRVSFAEHPPGREVTLYVFRVPPTPTQRLADTLAQIHLASYDSTNPNSVNNFARVGAGVYTYNCLLPSGSGKLKLHVRGIGLNSKKPDDPALARQVSVAAWSEANHAWQPLQGTLHLDNSPAGGWNYDAPVEAEQAQGPQHQMRLQLQLHTGYVRVSTVKISR
jgi:hypothetical protein